MKESTKKRDTRINLMSEAYERLGRLTAVLGENTEELEAAASDIDSLKNYMSSGQWIKDFEADEKGKIGPEVNRSVLSEDGLYNLLSDLDDLLHSFERILERFK